MSKITVTTIAGATSGADANKVKIESGDQLGVGTTPTHPLTVNGQIKSIGSNGETVQLQTSNQFSGVSFIGSDGTRDAIMDYDHTNGVMSLKAHTAGHLINFTTGGYTERFRITDNGVTFNGDTAAANALDDYEEGTFTPTMSTAGSYGAQLGFYTKVGRIVHCQITLQWVNSGTSTGTLGGLPFTVFGQNYVTIVSREYYSSGETWNANLAIGGTSSYSFTYSNNQSTVTNGGTYGLGLTFVYRVS